VQLRRTEWGVICAGQGFSGLAVAVIQIRSCSQPFIVGVLLSPPLSGQLKAVKLDELSFLQLGSLQQGAARIFNGRKSYHLQQLRFLSVRIARSTQSLPSVTCRTPDSIGVRENEIRSESRCL
jgi:hypothetical protein